MSLDPHDYLQLSPMKSIEKPLILLICCVSVLHPGPSPKTLHSETTET